VFNKGSCRGCGSYLVPTANCNTCTEHVYWICNKCNLIEEVFHSHNYCRFSHNKIEINSKKHEAIISKCASLLVGFRNMALISIVRNWGTLVSCLLVCFFGQWQEGLPAPILFEKPFKLWIVDMIRLFTIPWMMKN